MAASPAESVQRYEHEAMGDLLHIDIKKLGRIEPPSHRRDSVKGAGWEFLFVAVDDHARVAFTGMHPNERQESAVCSSCMTQWPTTQVWACASSAC